MTARDWAAVVPLAAGVVVLLLSALGLLATRGAYARLHASGPATILGVPLVAVALMIATGPASATAVRGVLVAGLLLGCGPVLSHAIARAERLRMNGKLEVEPGEEVQAP